MFRYLILSSIGVALLAASADANGPGRRRCIPPCGVPCCAEKVAHTTTVNQDDVVPPAPGEAGGSARATSPSDRSVAASDNASNNNASNNNQIRANIAARVARVNLPQVLSGRRSR